MLAKQIKYRRPIDNEECVKTFYFALDKRELLEMEMTALEGIGERIDRIKDAKDNKKIVEEFKDIIRKAYGEIGEDGEHFLKMDKDGRPLWRMFEQHPAYEQLYLELLGTKGSAAEFIRGIMPTDVQNHPDVMAYMKANETIVE